MEFLQLLKLPLLALFNRAFRTQVVVTTQIDPKGFNIYEYEGTPSVTPGFFMVKFRHRLNGESRETMKMRMTDREWASVCAKMEKPEHEVA